MGKKVTERYCISNVCLSHAISFNLILKCFHEYDGRWQGQLLLLSNLYIESAPWVNTAENYGQIQPRSYGILYHQIYYLVIFYFFNIYRSVQSKQGITVQYRMYRRSFRDCRSLYFLLHYTHVRKQQECRLTRRLARQCHVSSCHGMTYRSNRLYFSPYILLQQPL